ncbi:hypothetical protein STVIR_8146 [Streptomyces viridochromogenes Tue57]|uniref:Uncharacterized protein n=1 Tax=Streptomyces viridochromogenes Tue57 TaxID=1160705 RepID=L8P464_STRVR|nr:hypothetical protein STVIR_8146 [Streptomyces viridochromogenes Tue57]
MTAEQTCLRRIGTVIVVWPPSRHVCDDGTYQEQLVKAPARRTAG